MADSFYDAPRRGNRDWPDMRLADGVAPLNRIYNDSVTVSADLVRRFVKEERAVREVLVCPATVAGDDIRVVLEGGFELILDGTGEMVTEAAKTRVVDVSGCETAVEVAAAIARSVAGWLPVFVGVAVGDAVGIYTSTGAGAVLRVCEGTGVNEVMLDWARRAEEVGILRPGLPPDCLVGSYHPQCAYLMLVGVKLTSATDTHATFSRTWQVDLAKLGEEEAVDIEAMLRMGATSAQTLEKTLPPPRQFLPWVRTITETRKARVTEVAEVREELMGATVNEESLAASTKTETRQEWGAPFVLRNLAMDPETGEMRETKQEVVPAGTFAAEINETGEFESVQQVDDLWAIKTTVQAAGLAGQAVKGVAERSYGYRDNYSWPRILDYIDIQPVLADPGDAYSGVVQYAWRPVWLSEGYDGPCDYQIVERWTLKKPVVGGDPFWNTDSAADRSPNLPTETAMILREIMFQGADLNLQIPRCLHSGLWIRDSQFFQSYPPSIPMRWPATILSRVTLTPDSGGWLTRTYSVNAPRVEGMGSGLMLMQEMMPAGDAEGGAPVAGTTFTLVWNDGEPDELTTLEIAASPTFDGSFLPGYAPMVVTGQVREVVQGVARGTIYYARLKRGGDTSNTCICATRPMPELGVFVEGQPLVSGDEQPVGQVEAGESGLFALTLKNIGLKTLSDVSVTLGGPDADMMTAGEVPGYLLPNSGADLVIQFDPTSAGVKTVELTVSSNDEASPFMLTLKGTGAAPDIQVEQPAGTVVLLDGEVNFGLTTGASVSKVFKMVNVGNAPLRNLGLSLAGENADDFTVSSGLEAAELGPNGFTHFTVTFEPLGSEAVQEAREAVLAITSDDREENTFNVRLAGLFQDPLAAGALDPDYEPDADGEVHAVALQADGKAVIGGSFENVNGSARNGCARLLADGTVDSFHPDCNGTVLAIAIQADGKVVLGGDFTTVDGHAQAYLARVESTGAFDSSFTPVLDEEVRALAVQADGHLLLGGAFTTVNAAAKPYLARLLPDGTLDGGFTSEVDGVVNGIALMEGGKVLITGDWPGDLPPTTTTEPTTTLDPTTTTTSTTTTSTTTTTTTTTTSSTTTSTTTTVDPTTTTTEEPTTTEDPTTTTTPEPTTTAELTTTPEP